MGLALIMYLKCITVTKCLLEHVQYPLKIACILGKRGQLGLEK